MARAAKNPKTGLTDKQERFAQEYVKNGGNASAAYRVVYSAKGKESTINRSAKELMDNPTIAARIAGLRAVVTQQAIEEATVDRAWVLSRLKTVTERCLQAAPVLDRKGLPVLVETPEGDLVPAFMFNSMGANRSLELLGKEIGMFVERKEQGRPGEFADLKGKSEAELEQEARELLAAGVKQGVIKVLPRKSQKAA